MKCPACGHWNRDSFPRCFRCGAELPRQASAADRQADAPVQPATDEGPAKIYIQISEDGQATSPVDERDQLAREMENLLARKQRGEEEHQRLQVNSVRQGIAPTGRAVQTLTGRRPFPIPQNISYTSDDDPAVEGSVRPDAIPVTSQRVIGEEYPEYDPVQAVTGSDHGRRRRRQVKMYRHMGARRFFRALLIVLLLAAAGVAVWKVGLPLITGAGSQFSLADRTEITVSILDDMPAHSFSIHLPEYDGQMVWIKEMKKHYDIVDGYASFTRVDYDCYETSDIVTQESVTATITASLKTTSGEHRALGQLEYEVEIPLSPLNLVNPPVNWAETSLVQYPLQFEVAKNSTVTINGQNYSDLVNTQDGLINVQAPISPIGDNVFVITTRAQHYRENSQTVTIYREFQEIPLDLDVDIATDRYSPGLVDDTSKPPDKNGKYPQIEDKMTIRGTTIPDATLTVKSDYEDLDLTRQKLDGSFSFKAVFNRIGTNSIIIEASREGYKTSTVQLDIYYVPIAAIYTRKAWDINKEYTDYLNHSETRVANTQIYVCKGVITEIVSERPQIAVMKLNSDYERTVLLRNYSNDTWEVGKEYRIFADAYGVYNGAPWLNGRYTYDPL